MIYQVDVVNPKTNEEQTITVELTPEQNAEARACADWVSKIWSLATLPAGFMPIGTRTRPLPLTAIN
ncbi:hypothetical protein V1283_003304 [Bradyrhizobium sp. AZCC 2262]|uniref:hypothetical protein n=1 Tax=Bradyrhizobium sp. AZCC 2262 TaxID=3117022 RepID=UPI002FF3AB1A